MRSLQLVEFGAPLEWREQPTPEPAGGEVLLETMATGVCHSDLHLWDGYYGDGAVRTYVKDRGVRLPITLGHEIVGRVVAAGPDAEGVAVGDVRLVYPWIGCGACRHCVDERSNHCSAMRSLGVLTHGGYADHVLVPDARCLLDIGTMRPEEAASYACAGLTAYAALRKLPPLEADEELVIVGAGGVGLMAAQVVRPMTQARVTFVDLDGRKLEAARTFGDFDTIDGSAVDPREALMRRTDGRGVAAVVDFVGSSQTAALGQAVLAKNGTLVIVGLFGGEMTVPTHFFPLRNATIRGSYTGSLRELRELLALVRERGVRPVPVACHALEEVPRILEEMRQGRVVGRAVVVPR
ncbi:MAG TPA: alcohol dehydrogenase [Longimicrobium sp.]|jgi:D-arabinose 1-dehydrogenase-like Zn-dependent alcohol dehydrogenase|nr:alcohol dehydrogenase [Longimicrobium sp.]